MSNSESRLIKFEHQASDIGPVDITAEYQYDIYGRRIQKKVNGVETNFFWDGDTMTLELNDQNKPIRRYITGTSVDDYEGHLEYSEVTDWGKIFDFNYPSGWYSYIKDQVGTIYRVYDHKNHTYVNTRRFDVFGNMLNQTGTPKTNLGFQGKYLDTESGLYYFYHRYYLPSIGRFITEDPIGLEGGLNLFNFVEYDPINLFDPFGLYHYNAPPPRTVPVSGRTEKALRCFEKCIQIGTGDRELDLLVTGGAEKSGHSRGSGHYRNRACDIAGPRFNPITFINVLYCAESCGFNFVLWEIYFDKPNKDHWHLERKPRDICEDFSCHL